MRDTPLPYTHHDVTDADVAAVAAAMRSGWLTGGPLLEEFEQAVANYVGATHAVAFSSGTAALHAAVAVSWTARGYLLVSPLTFCATANCGLYCGLTPAFGDVLPTGNLDPAMYINNNTQAVVVTHYAGQPADLDSLKAVTTPHGIPLIEDACHALGAVYKGERIGSISDMTVFSFHPAKHITTGEGGMVTTNSADYAQRLRRFRNQGMNMDVRERQRRNRWDYDVTTLGYNYRLNEMACALGLSQLKRLDANLARRQAIAERYMHAFANGPVTPLQVMLGVKHAWHLFPVLANTAKERNTLLRSLRQQGIMASTHYTPVYQHSLYRNRGYTLHRPVAEDLASRLISLPLFPAMTDHDVQDVIAAVGKEFL